jgi:hypothetical protein
VVFHTSGRLPLFLFFFLPSLSFFLFSSFSILSKKHRDYERERVKLRESDRNYERETEREERIPEREKPRETQEILGRSETQKRRRDLIVRT